MKKSAWIKPYNKDGSTNLIALTNTSGVYLIRKIGNKLPVYIGMSAGNKKKPNLYKTILRHFQSWEDSQTRVTYPKQGYEIRVIKTTPLQALRLEKSLIIAYKPKDNPNKYEQYEIETPEERLMQKAAELPEDYFFYDMSYLNYNLYIEVSTCSLCNLKLVSNLFYLKKLKFVPLC